MLTPEDRIAAIEALADFHASRVTTYQTSNGVDVHRLLTYGFRGFASYSDKELVDNMMRIRDQHYQCSSILARIAENELLK